MFKLFKKQGGEVPPGNGEDRKLQESGPERQARESHDKEPSEESAETEVMWDESDSAGSETDEAGDANKAEELIERFRGWLAENLSDDDKRQKAEDVMRNIVGSLTEGGGEDLLFEIVTKGSDYERATAEAEASGELKGRNSKIAEERALQMEGDGVPHPGAGGGVYDAPSPSIFEVARGVW